MEMIVAAPLLPAIMTRASACYRSDCPWRGGHYIFPKLGLEHHFPSQISCLNGIRKNGVKKISELSVKSRLAGRRINS